MEREDSSACVQVFDLYRNVSSLTRAFKSLLLVFFSLYNFTVSSILLLSLYLIGVLHSLSFNGDVIPIKRALFSTVFQFFLFSFFFLLLLLLSMLCMCVYVSSTCWLASYGSRLSTCISVVSLLYIFPLSLSLLWSSHLSESRCCLHRLVYLDACMCFLCVKFLFFTSIYFSLSSSPLVVGVFLDGLAHLILIPISMGWRWCLMFCPSPLCVAFFRYCDHALGSVGLSVCRSPGPFFSLFAVASLCRNRVHVVSISGATNFTI